MKKLNFFEKEAFLITILVFIPIFSFSNFITDFIVPKGTHYSDYSISHYPNLLFLKTSIFSLHQIPLWNGQILSGFPNIANPLAGLWYPGNWLTILFPLPLGTNLVTVLHLIIAGIGMYLFLRQQKMTTFGAFFGAMAFQLFPKLFAHYAAGHVSLVQAITWTPWILYLQQKRFHLSHRNFRFWYQVAPFYALVMLCDIRWTFYLVLLDLLFFIKQGKEEILPGIKQGMINCLGWFSQVITGTLLSAIFLIPFLEYVALTDRSKMVAADILANSMPFAKLMGFMIPDMGGYAEWTIYPGLAIWVCFLGVLSLPSLRKKYSLVYGFIFLCLIYSISGEIPGMSWIANIPGINLLRVPSRIFLLIGICMIIMAADYLSQLDEEEDIKKKVNLLPVFFTLLFTIAILLIIKMSGDIVISDFSWPVVISAILFFLFLGKKYFFHHAMFFKFTLIIVMMFDLTVVNASQYDEYSAETVLSQDNLIYETIGKEIDPYARVYSPSYRMEQQLAAYNGIDLVDGIDPLHLDDYATYMEKASGVVMQNYSVTIPAFESGKAQSDNQDAIINTAMLGRLNTQFVVSTFEIQNTRLSLVSSDEQTFIYRNKDNYPHAWVESGDTLYLDRVSDLIIEPNQIALNAKGPGLLVLSEIAYPGWNVWVDGQEAPIVKAYDILRAVDLPAGNHTIEMHFQPKSLFWGGVLSVVTLLLLLGFEFIRTFDREEKNE
jgi:hypothetical protein